MNKRWLAVISTLLLLVLVIPSFAGNAEVPQEPQERASSRSFSAEAEREEFRETMKARKLERIDELIEKGELTKEEGDNLRLRLEECQGTGENRELSQELGLRMGMSNSAQGKGQGMGQGNGQGLGEKLRDGSCLNN